jgi:hypothetical protein
MVTWLYFIFLRMSTLLKGAVYRLFVADSMKYSIEKKIIEHLCHSSHNSKIGNDNIHHILMKFVSLYRTRSYHNMFCTQRGIQV